MKKQGEWLTLTIVTDAKKSSELNIGKPFMYLQVVIPAVVEGTLNLEVSESSGGTFQTLGSSDLVSATEGAFSDVWTLGGYQFIKVKSSAQQITTDRVFRVRGYSLG